MGILLQERCNENNKKKITSREKGKKERRAKGSVLPASSRFVLWWCERRWRVWENKFCSENANVGDSFEREERHDYRVNVFIQNSIAVYPRRDAYIELLPSLLFSQLFLFSTTVIFPRIIGDFSLGSRGACKSWLGALDLACYTS